MAEHVYEDTQLRDWLRSLKESSGSSYADIARAIGEQERNVKRWMVVTGTPTIPRGDSLLRMLDYFGVQLIPPAPRSVALSLMGEIREVQEQLHRLESGEEGERRLSLHEIDARLEELAASVAEMAELLRPVVARRGKPGAAQKQAKGAG